MIELRETTKSTQHPMHTRGLTQRRITGWLRLGICGGDTENPRRTASLTHKLNRQLKNTAGTHQKV